MPSPPDIARLISRASCQYASRAIQGLACRSAGQQLYFTPPFGLLRVRRALLAWVSLAALLFATSIAPLLHESLHAHLHGHTRCRAHAQGPATADGLAAAEPCSGHQACPICLTLAGLHLARTAPALAPRPEIIASLCQRLDRPPRLGLLQPLGFRHRGPPAWA